MTPATTSLLTHLANRGDAGALIVPGSPSGFAAAPLIDCGYASVGGYVLAEGGVWARRLRVTQAGKGAALELDRRRVA